MTGLSALPVAEDSFEDDSQWTGTSKILGPRWLHLPTLTIGLFGVQVFWSVEMSYASPYLLSLGLTKAWMAIVFLAGPLSGLIVQPFIGVLADQSKSRFGRRRPFLLAGSILCTSAMLLLGFTRPFAGIFVHAGSSANSTLTIWLAVIAIYCIDFSINAVQAVDRALLVDSLPSVEQASGNAWAARMLGIGSVAGFFVGEIDLPRLLPFLGNSQIEVLSVISSLLLVMTHIIKSICVKEKVLLYTSRSTRGFVEEIKVIWTTLMTLPRVIKQICIIQFFAWLAWFPVLFYTTVYIGELHKRSSPTPPDDDAAAALDAEATRLGTRALFYSSLVTVGANIVMPLFVSETERLTGSDALTSKKSWWTCLQMHLASLWCASHLIFALCMGATFFTTSASVATVIMTLTGFSWAITQWAPFSLLAEAILSHSTTDGLTSIHLEATHTTPRSSQDEDERQRLVEARVRDVANVPRTTFSQEENGILRNDNDDYSGPQPDQMYWDSSADSAPPSTHVNAEARPSKDLSSQAGAILGIHNLFIVVPQFLVTALSSVVFAIFEPEKSILHGHHPGNTISVNGTSANFNPPKHGVGIAQQRLEDDELYRDGPNSVAIIFRIGGVAAIVAFVLCWRLSTELRHRGFN